MAQRINPSIPQYKYWSFVPPTRSKIFDLVIYPLIID